MQPAPRVLGRITEIASDNRSGADTLARKAAEALELQAQEQPLELGTLRAALAAAARLLVAAQPAMASIFNLANAVLYARDTAGDAASIAAAVVAACRGFIARIEQAQQAISRAARPHIPTGAAVVTHSFSSTVAAALLEAWRNGRRFSVICTESRPALEGVALARTLAAAGIPVTLVADAAVWRHLNGATLALCGADTVSPRGVVNKAGTALLALAARAQRKPFFVLAGAHKFVPAGWDPDRERPRDPRELLPEAIAGVAVSNLYFDLTPLRLVTAVITEDGAYEPADVRRRLRALKVHPALRACLAAPVES